MVRTVRSPAAVLGSEQAKIAIVVLCSYSFESIFQGSTNYFFARMFSRVASRVTKTTGRRFMAGGGHHKVEYTGIDAVVRKFLPEDRHVMFLSADINLVNY